MLMPKLLLATGQCFLSVQSAAQAYNIALRGRAEELLIVAAEVRRILIADAKPRACRVQIFPKHQTACFLPGTTVMAHMVENSGAAGLRFTPSEITELNSAVRAIEVKGQRLPDAVLAFSGVEAPMKK